MMCCSHYRSSFRRSTKYTLDKLAMSKTFINHCLTYMYDFLVCPNHQPELNYLYNINWRKKKNTHLIMYLQISIFLFSYFILKTNNFHRFFVFSTSHKNTQKINEPQYKMTNADEKIKHKKINIKEFCKLLYKCATVTSMSTQIQLWKL